MTEKKLSISRLAYYFKREIWEEGYVNFKTNPRVFLAQRLYMVFKGLFMEKHWGYAAQLTLNTLMAIIPVFAVIFAVGRGFGFEDYIAQWCYRVFASQPGVADAVLQLSRSYIDYTHTGMIVGVSLVFMLYSVISLFNNVENVFNEIWGVQMERSMGRAVMDYVSIIFLVPLAIILFSGVSVFFYSIFDHIPDFQLFTPIAKSTIRLILPLAMLTFFFTLLYGFLPNTKVNVSSVWFPALLAGICIISLQAVYIHYQMLFTSYSVIYGSLAALPLFVLWMQLSWFICIGFAELGRANQELKDGHLGENRRESLLEQIRKTAVVLSLFCRRQRMALGPMSAQELLTQTRFSYSQLHRCLQMLLDAHLISRTQRDDATDVFTLNHSTDDVHVGMMIELILGRKSPEVKEGDNLQLNADAEATFEHYYKEFLDKLDDINVEHLTVTP